jgi:hypothetical protein
LEINDKKAVLKFIDDIKTTTLEFISGHESVWHGSVDILHGMNVVVCNASGDYEQFTEEREPGFEIKKT